MTISYREELLVTCVACTASFSAEAWLILDAREQPEQVDRLRQGYLNSYTCPQCGQADTLPVPLLFHDAVAQILLFAPAIGQAEHAWREQLRDLHTLLVGNIPEELRRAYLEDVQIAQDIDGMAHILRKRSRRAQPAQNAGWIDLAGSSYVMARSVLLPPASEPVRVAEPPVPAAVYADDAAPSSTHTSDQATAWLQELVQRLIQADTLETVYALVEQYPVLLGTAADLLVKNLADLAVDQREHALAEGLRQVRLLLADLRAGKRAEPRVHAAPGNELAESTPDPDYTTVPAVGELPDHVWQMLLHVQSSQDLLQAVQDEPVLLAEWVDAALSDQIDHALEESNERLAHDLEIRREALEILRESLLT